MSSVYVDDVYAEVVSFFHVVVFDVFFWYAEDEYFAAAASEWSDES